MELAWVGEWGAHRGFRSLRRYWYHPNPLPRPRSLHYRHGQQGTFDRHQRLEAQPREQTALELMRSGVHLFSLKLPIRYRPIVRTCMLHNLLLPTISVARALELGGRPFPTQKHGFVVGLQCASL